MIHRRLFEEQEGAKVDCHGRVNYSTSLEALEEGGYVATSPDVPGLVAEGRTATETVEIAQGLTRKIVESCLDHGDPVPPALQNLVGDVETGSIDLLVQVTVR